MIVNEKNFVQRLRRKDEKALEYIIDKYGDLVETIVFKRLYTLQHLLDECISDVFFKCWENISQFDENKCSFKKWICAIAKYKSIDYQRKYLKHNNLLNIEDIALTDSSNCPERLADFQSDLNSILNYLKPHDRKIFIKLFLEGESVKEVSADMGIKESTIYSKVCKGRKLIKKERELHNEK